MVVAGFGWRQGATPDSLRAALALALRQLSSQAADPADPAQLVQGPITLLATAQDKANAACLQTLAAQLGLPVHAVPLALLKAVPTATRSAVVQRLRGSGSVAEAAALAAAAALTSSHRTAFTAALTVRLLHPRSVSPDRLATCALATFDLLHPQLP